MIDDDTTLAIALTNTQAAIDAVVAGSEEDRVARLRAEDPTHLWLRLEASLRLAIASFALATVLSVWGLFLGLGPVAAAAGLVAVVAIGASAAGLVGSRVGAAHRGERSPLLPSERQEHARLVSLLTSLQTRVRHAA